MAKKKPGYYFDEAAANIAVAFFERILVHVKGEWYGDPFILAPWERKIIRDVFGWKRADGTRRYRFVYIEVPRKNGKSTLAAGIALLLLFADDEPGAEVYSAAGDRDQAAIVFDLAKSMTEESAYLSQRSDPFKRSIIVPSTRSVYKVLSADAYTKHGLNAHGVIFDELHVQPNRDLWDVLTTSTGARRQPLVIAITTAGYDKNSICYEQHEYARQVLDGIIEDDSYYAYIAAADYEDDWLDPKTWIKANPNLGVTIKLEYLEQEAKRAEQVPAYQNTFRRLHLSQWTAQETRWLPMDAWDKGSDLEVDLDELEGLECYGGLDLSSTIDITAFTLSWPSPEVEIDIDGNRPESEPIRSKSFFWIPEDNLIERSRKDRVPYDAWVRDGLIMTTPGNVIDYAYIVKEIEQLGEIYNIQEIAFDRWGAFQVSQQLENAGFTMVAFGQGFVSMSAPTKELLRLTLNRKLAHGGNPVLRWMADNLVVKMDPAGNVKPDKSKSREKIDGIVSLIMSLDRLIRHGGEPGSVYETRGLLAL
jgi:phage terminase large subunit-like protein